MMLEDIFPVTIIQIRCCGSKLDYLHLLNTDVSVSLLACCSRFTVCSSLRSDAQTLHTSMPIAWIPGRYGNRYVAHTDLHPLITLVAMVTCFQWELECCRGRRGRMSETKFWQQLSRPIRRHTADRRPPPPPSDPRLHLPLQSLLVHSNQCFSKFVCHDSVASDRCWWVVCVSAVEGMKVVEIEKCRNDIKKLREEMASRNNRWQRHTLSLPDVTGQIHSGTVVVSMLTAANWLILLTVVDLAWESQEACDWLKEERGGAVSEIKIEIIKS